ncbi:mRNA-degrading endonuclease HigB of HigAB toxin-antitoxin module [Chryseobacterium defluvii]|uniref:mRNA-degrading endonuclease HigB of HigAB toxin-antitoxin module n=1 Tax=Chryseobacterium defluvii TaxID=160396 RepID=A0A840KDQ6_9FLAO|nr:hypothetical protein [Chryseobacterium defluvii]MBB4806117.1 mRNA-degrading endonuclease HigB of HigAB toxin-antitoxin module [Chryseobacterium defluvii]
MNYRQAVQEITKIFPEIENELQENKTRNSYNVIRTFTNHINKMILGNRKKQLFKSMKMMNDLYKNGDASLRNAIENTFIYSLDNCTVFCSKEYRKVVFNLISFDLQKIYLKQIYRHGM